MNTYAGGAMTQESDGRVKTSMYLDPDVLGWLRQRGERLDRSVIWQVREILRTAMNSDQREPAGAPR
jgi:uncharacterized protein (DUF4415 family)